MKVNYDNSLEIPLGIEVHVGGNIVRAKGPKGEIERNFANPRIAVTKENNNILIKCKGSKPSQVDKTMINTFSSHISNILKGVNDGYIAKLKICSGHFPMQVKVEGMVLQIKNFLGEKIPREADIIEGVKVEVKGDIIEVRGVDKEKVGQTTARIEQATRITNRDRRIFQDGCYIITKAGEEV